jgi:hypothetical protein
MDHEDHESSQLAVTRTHEQTAPGEEIAHRKPMTFQLQKRVFHLHVVKEAA